MRELLLHLPSPVRDYLPPVLVGFAAGWIALAAFAWLFADKLLFPAPSPSYGASGGILRLPRADGGPPVAGWFLAAPGSRRLLLYHHGNGEDLGHLEGALLEFRARGWSVLAYDYPGYGLTPGPPSEQGSYAAAEAAWNHATTRLGFAPTEIVHYGRSLGSGPAFWLATRHPECGGIILEGAFTSAFRVITRIRMLPWDRFNNLRRIGQVKVPILVIHGTADEVVPFGHGQSLLAAAPAGRRSFLWVDGAGHNDVALVAGPAYWEAIERFMATAR